VKIYSEIGQGTTVKVYLPRYLGPASTVTIEHPKDNLPEGSPNEIVLVVEDEAKVRRMSVDALSELGYTVIQAESPSAALHLLESQKPNVTLLFTDIVMPEMSGRVLADQSLNRLPGYTRNAIVHNGVVDPGMAFLSKPFTLNQLARKIRQVIDGND
jgi:CheY-like chemotaxis protein